MSDKDINQMDFKELRNEVQLLRDELAIMQRKYEDLFYNLDTENFSGNFLKGINSKVSSGEVETMISQSADEIKLYAKKEAESQSSGVYSVLKVDINGIRGTVGDLSFSVSEIKETSNSIEMSVRDIVGGEESLFVQTANGFRLDGNQVVISNVNHSSASSGDYGDSYVKVLNTGLNLFVYDKNREQYIEKLGIGFYHGYYDHPYITFGAGTGESTDGDKYTGKQVGCIYKLGNGLWIGDASACNVGGDYPGGQSEVTSLSPTYTDGKGYNRDGRNISGIFIDLYNGKTYKYEKGIPTQI